MTLVSNKRSFLLLRFAAVLGLMIVQVAIGAGVADKVIISVAGPMSGTSFSVGVQYRVGVTAALNVLSDGSLLGKEVLIEAHDDRCDAKIAEAVALELVEDRPSVVIGHSCSNATIVAAPIYADHDILQMTPGSTNPRVTEMGIDTIFRMIGRDDLQGQLAAERIANNYQNENIGILHFPGSYSLALAQSTIDGLGRLGLKPTIVIEARSSAASYVDDIVHLMEADVDVLYLVGGVLDSAIFLRQALKMGASFAVISSDTLVSEIFPRTAGSAAENVIFTFPPNAVDLPTANPAVKAIKEMGADPAGYTLLAYAATEVWIEGVRRAQNFDSNEVAVAIRSKPVSTILGEVSFDLKGDIQTVYQPFAWHVWREGKRVRID